MTDKIKNQKGITLIALIVTIIVLIILAAVGISMLLGENGITEKARWSKTVTEFERIDEEKKLYLTEKQINEYGKVPKRIQKFSFQSLFTNISYASDSAKTNDTIYPIIQGDDGKVDIKNVEYTLRTTIKKSELQGNKDRLNKPKYVDLRKVDLKLLGETKVEREYVINVAEKGNGELYWLNKVPYQGLAWHTPRAKNGVDEDAEESDYVIHYLTGNGKEEVIRNIPNGSSKIQLENRNDLGITQEGKFFLHWKDVTNEPEYKEDDEDEEEEEEEEEETTGNEGKTYEDGDEINLETDRWLQNRNIYLKAVWQDGVILNANGDGAKIDGEQSITIRVIEGKEYGKELKEPTRTGYTFTGWYKTKEDDGSQPIKSDTKYDPSELTNSTLYAHWVDDIKPETFTISVDDLTSEGFTMNLSRVEDYGSKVKEVIYYVSDESPTLNTVNASSQSENTVTGLTKEMTKYVWAEVTDQATNTRISTNYVKVWTGHDHSTVDGVCFAWITEAPRLFSVLSKGDNAYKKRYHCAACDFSFLPAVNHVTWINTSYDTQINENLRVRLMCSMNSDTYGIHHADISFVSESNTKVVTYERRCPGCNRNGWDQMANEVFRALQCEHTVRTWPCTKELDPSSWVYNMP